MSYLVTARKWRPQNLHELVGQQHISRALKNAIDSDRVAHAYLFSGPRGVGKTSAARIFAKSLNCEEGITDMPCQKCSNCVEISNGSSLDVLEIDGASNRKIDDAREIRNNVKYLPSKSRYKIIIIDEVHMLTNEAFNALLKTLEEPPAHVVFIFATTESHKVKITIRSRCQHYHFRRIATPDIKSQLETISKAEGIEIEDKALYQIAKAADGSMRDSQSLFDQVIAYSDKDITAQKVEEILGVFSEEYFLNFLNCLVNKDIRGLLELIASLIKEGQDLVNFNLGLIDSFRTLIILKTSGEKDSAILEIPGESSGALGKYVEMFTDQQLIDIINELMSLAQELKKAVNEQFQFESALFRLVNYENFIQPAVILKKLEELEKSVLEGNPAIIVEESLEPAQIVKAVPTETKPIEAPVDLPVSEEKEDGGLPKDYWPKFMNILSKEKPMLAAFLGHAKNVEWNDGELHIYFDESLYHEEVNKSESKSIIENKFNECFHVRMALKSSLVDKVLSPAEEEHRKEAITTVADSFKGKIVSGDM